MMGDRTDLCITVMKKDEDAIVDVFGYQPRDKIIEDVFEEVEESLPGVFTCTAYEINYGGIDQITKLVARGVVFYGSHGAGDDYSSFGFVHDGKELREQLLTNDGVMVVTLKDNGDVYTHEIDEAKAYVAAVEDVQTIMAQYSERYHREEDNEGIRPMENSESA